MSITSKNHHTFNYLDPLLASERVQSLDDFFLELDVATHMVEGEWSHGAARLGYCLLRHLAMGVQLVAFGIFKLFQGIGYVGKLCLRAASVLFLDLPSAARKFFFPTAAELHQQWVESCQMALREGTFSVQMITGPEKGKYACTKQKELLHSLLIQPLKNHLGHQSHRCCELLEEIADGDLGAEALKSNEEEILTMIKGISLPYAQVLAKTFIEAFQSERAFENGLTDTAIRRDPSLLLKYPHLLMREDVKPIIRSSSKDLKDQLLAKKVAIEKRVLQQSHKKERRLFAKLSPFLQDIDLDTLEKIYTSEQERLFLERRLDLLKVRMQRLEANGKNRDFEFYLLSFESVYLKKQLDESQEKGDGVNFLMENKSHVEEINAMHKESRTQIYQHLMGRLPQDLREKLNRPWEEQSDQEQCTHLQEILSQVQSFERAQLNQGKQLRPIRMQESLIKYDKIYRNLSLHLDEWDIFTQLTTPSQREEARTRALTEAVICMLLEIKPECQTPLLLAKKDRHSIYQALSSTGSTVESKGVHRKIEEASQAFIRTIIEQYKQLIKNQLVSTTEFFSQVSKGADFEIFNEKLKHQELTESFDLVAASQNLKTAEALKQWHKALQQIWLEHMHYPQEESLLAITDRHSQMVKMAEYFNLWFEQMTGFKLAAELSFDWLRVIDRSEKRRAALATIKEQLIKDGMTLSEVAKRVKSQPAPEKPSDHKGFDPSQIKKEEKCIDQPDLRIPEPNPTPIHVQSQQVHDLITVLEHIREELGPEEDSLAWKMRWLKRLDHFVKQGKCQALHLLMVAQCKEIIRSCFDDTVKVPPNVIKIYSRYSLQNQPLEEMHNIQRSDYLATFLRNFFAANEMVDISVNEQIRLRQLCSLSSLSSAEKERILTSVRIVEESPFYHPNQSLMEMSLSLQASPIGLEGVDAEVAKQSFKKSGLPQTAETRMLLDHYMSCGSEALSFELIDHVYRYYGEDLSHHGRREAIARALTRAYAHNPDKTREYLLNKIEENKAHSLEYHPNTLAPNLCIFYCDLLHQVDPEAYSENTEVMKLVIQFNKMLLKSNEANHLLMGLSRCINDLSLAIQNAYKNKAECQDLVLELLKFKIAYQNLRQNHFDDAKKVTGFVQIESEAAEFYMTELKPIFQFYLNNIDQEKVRDYLNKVKAPNNKYPYTQFVSGALSSIEGVPQFVKSQIDGFFKLGSGVVLDTLTGMIYNDGQQKINLHPHLQNHPCCRTLGIHKLAYIWDADLEGFVYQENGQRKPYLLIKEENRIPVIYKRLPRSFDLAQSDYAYLRFIPKEEIRLPMSVMHRLQIQHFWQDKDGQLYGYDADGRLVGIVSERGTIETQDDFCHFANPENLPPFLLTHFDPNEILVSQLCPGTFYIPALQLTVNRFISATGDEGWRCHAKGMEEKILQASGIQSAPLLTISNQVPTNKEAEIQRNLKEACYRRDLLKGKEKLSLLEQHKLRQLEASVISQKQKLLALLEPQYLVAGFDQAQVKVSIEFIEHLIPSPLVDEFYDFNGGEEVPVYELYLTALQFLRKEVDDLNRGGGPLKEISEVVFAYLEIQKMYEMVCNQSLERILFDQSPDASALTRDLTGALTLAMGQLSQKDQHPLHLINELSKHPLQKAMSDSQCALLDRAIELCSDAELRCYLLLMQYQHVSYKLREFAVTPLASQREVVKKMTERYGALERKCQSAITKLKRECVPSKAMLALWKKLNIEPNHPFLQENESSQTKVEKPLHQTSITEFQILGSKSPLERMKLEHLIEATPKSKAGLSQHQKNLSRAFQTMSHSQVSGFYFEKMGYFSLLNLYSEFRLEGENALYGLHQKDLNEIFTFLHHERIITQTSDTQNYSRLVSAEWRLSTHTANKLRARLAPLNLDQEAIQKVIERIEALLFRAMQSGFTFSTKERAKQEIHSKLNQEREIHLEKYLEAEERLRLELSTYNASMVDLKYAYLTGDYQRFASPGNQKEIARLSHLMTLYLFHKTEVQHIENIQKAPVKGERNQIELLQTKRNYPVDLLFHEGLTGNMRREQVMQRAFLAFEEDYGNRCNLMQIRMFRSLMLGNSSGEGIDAIQARMGFGKTALLILLAVVRVAIERIEPVEKRHLVRYVVPRAVLEDNTRFFNQRFSSILGRNVVQDRDFARYQIDRKDPKTSFQLILTDLQSRLHFYEQMRKEGNMVIQPPEIRCSMEAQDLDFSEILREESLKGKAYQLCLEAKKLLVQIRSIPTYNVFDELDDTQDFRSREVNFTRGTKVSMPIETIHPIEKLVSYIEQNKHQDWTDKRARADEMVKALCQDRKGNPIDRCPHALIDYLTDSSVQLNKETRAFLSEKNLGKTENDSLFFLIRMALLDEFILSLIRNKQPSTHYGIRFAIDPKNGERRYSFDADTQSALLISVPYEGVNTPKGLSVYDNREVAAITTLRYYLSKETSLDIDPHLDFLVTQAKKEAIPAELAKHYLPTDGDDHPAVVALGRMARMLNPHELRKAKEAFYNQYMKQPTEEFRKFFAMVVLATQVRSDEGCAKSDRYEQGSPHDIHIGCSGTVGETSSYFTHQVPDPAADGMLSLEIMGRENNQTIEWLTPPQHDQDYLTAIIETLLDHAKHNTQAIADVAGMCKSRDGNPETVVEELWKGLQARPHLRSHEGIVYYGKDNVKRLFRPGKEAIICTTEMELAAIAEGRKYFFYYKQSNCRGSDIKQPNEIHTLITLDENVSNSETKQTTLRSRNIVRPESGQSFSFAAMPDYQKVVKAGLVKEKAEQLSKISRELAKPESPKHSQLRKQKQLLEAQIQAIPALNLEAQHVAHYLRLQEINSEEEHALILFRKEMKAHIKVAANHLEADFLSYSRGDLESEQKEAYHRYLEIRNCFSPLIERALNTLYEKYGTATQEMKRDELISQQQQIVQNALNELFRAAAACAQTFKCRLSTKKEIYLKRMEESIERFKQRYPEDRPVRIAATQSEGQNIAQAQAQALAEAEACSESVSQVLLERQERISTPQIMMSETDYKKPSLEFLADETLCADLTAVANLETSIAKPLRDRFKLSPGVVEGKEISHFALFHEDDEEYILVTHDEAEVFMKTKEALSPADLPASPLFPFILIDMRTCRLPDHALFSCIALGDNGVPEEYERLTTSGLRGTALTNATPQALLPSLTVTHSHPDQVNFFKITTFGLAQESTCSLTLKPGADEEPFKIACALPGKEVVGEIPRNNQHLTQIIQDSYSKSTEKKMRVAYHIINEKCEALQPKIDELNRKKVELERLTQENQRLIESVGSFNLSATMRGGLRRRDSEFRADTQKQKMQSKIGEDAISMCDEIVKLQKEIGRELSFDKLRELQEKFDLFVSNETLTQVQTPGFNYETSHLFDASEWKEKLKVIELEELTGEKKFNELPILERIYGRIVHTVHISNLGSCVSCDRDDCNQTFSTLIPNLLRVVPPLQTAIVTIEKNEEEKSKIEAEIEDLRKSAEPWFKALEHAKDLVKAQDEIEAALAKSGFYIKPHTFFDHFDLSDLSALPTEEGIVTLQGSLPEYRLTVDNMKKYQKAFSGLTAAEAENYRRNQGLMQHTLRQSRAIEDRKDEVHQVIHGI